MARTLRLTPLPRPNGPAGEMLAEFGLDRAEVARMWRMLLVMAVRDSAASVHWHPWRGENALAYVVAGVRYSLVRPPPALDPLVAATGRELVAPPGVRSAVGRWLGRPVAGRFRCEGEYGVSEWCGVWWRAGGVCGVELHRLDITATPIVEAYCERGNSG